MQATMTDLQGKLAGSKNEMMKATNLEKLASNATTRFAAFKAGDAVKLQRFSSQLTGHVLAPYLEYWRLKLRLEDMPDADVRAFLEQQSGSYLADRLRADWLKELGKRADWQTFEQQEQKNQDRDERSNRQTGEGHRERHQENRLNVEDKENDGVQIILGSELDLRVAD